mmetsp:Transcript_21247/g.50493  ORF Transcript_21247/g.50493 Transcript_21247/m.50493 type:complete len:307 (+) Transcript_21247:1281-2201(+)
MLSGVTAGGDGRSRRVGPERPAPDAGRPPSRGRGADGGGSHADDESEARRRLVRRRGRRLGSGPVEGGGGSLRFRQVEEMPDVDLASLPGRSSAVGVLRGLRGQLLLELPDPSEGLGLVPLGGRVGLLEAREGCAPERRLLFAAAFGCAGGVARRRRVDGIRRLFAVVVDGVRRTPTEGRKIRWRRFLLLLVVRRRHHPAAGGRGGDGPGEGVRGGRTRGVEGGGDGGRRFLCVGHDGASHCGLLPHPLELLAAGRRSAGGRGDGTAEERIGEGGLLRLGRSREVVDVVGGRGGDDVVVVIVFFSE